MAWHFFRSQRLLPRSVSPNALAGGGSQRRSGSLRKSQLRCLAARRPTNQIDGRVEYWFRRAASDRTQFTAAFRAKPGAHATIASIEVEGVELVSPDRVSRELTFALREPFSIQALEASRSKLLSLGLLLWVLTSCVLNVRPFIHQESAAG